MTMAPEAAPALDSRAVPATLEADLDHCARLTKAGAKSFYFAFAILPREQKRAMYAVYAFCREADDIVDEPGEIEVKRAALDRFESGLGRAFAGQPEGPTYRALAHVAARYGLSQKHFAHVIEGCRWDLDRARYETWADLEKYLDRVASAVGRITMQVFGLDPEARAAYAIAGGHSVQLTNILRDVREDFALGRVYIPQEDLRRFGVAESDLGADRPTDRLRELMRFQVARARTLYEQAATTIPERERRTLLPLTAITRIYARLLDEIERRRYDVLSERVAVPGWKKALIGISSLLRARLRLPMGR
jgi:phytoene synthase